MSDVFDALGDPTRRHIVESLVRQEASATQLASELPVTFAALARPPAEVMRRRLETECGVRSAECGVAESEWFRRST